MVLKTEPDRPVRPVQPGTGGWSGSVCPIKPEARFNRSKPVKTGEPVNQKPVKTGRFNIKHQKRQKKIKPKIKPMVFLLYNTIFFTVCHRFFLLHNVIFLPKILFLIFNRWFNRFVIHLLLCFN